jgi:hypothetical protein
VLIELGVAFKGFGRRGVGIETGADFGVGIVAFKAILSYLG